MLVVRCNSCGKELCSNNGRPQCCGCSNLTSINGDKISAKDLGQVVIVSSDTNKSDRSKLSEQDIAWQESRRQRKVRKLDFEIR